MCNANALSYFDLLLFQVEAGNEEVVNELLVQGANVDLQDKVSLYHNSILDVYYTV